MDQISKTSKCEEAKNQPSADENKSESNFQNKENINLNPTYKTESLACFVRILPFVISLSIIIFLGFAFIFVHPLLDIHLPIINCRFN